MNTNKSLIAQIIIHIMSILSNYDLLFYNYFYKFSLRNQFDKLLSYIVIILSYII